MVHKTFGPRAVVWLGLVLATLAGARARAESAPRPDGAAITVWIAGDLLVGPDQGDVLESLPTMIANGVGIVNLEGPIADPSPARASQLAGPAEGLRLTNDAIVVEALRAAGIGAVSLANNHALDLGSSGLEATVERLRDHGIEAATGAEPATLAVGDRTLIVSAFDLSERLPESLSSRLVADRQRGDVLIVLFHVTGPPSYLPSPILRAATEIALATGARVVAAHGTHVVGPVEQRGDAVIAWGLGNLAFDCECTDERDAIALVVRIDGDDRLDASVVPLRAGLSGDSVRPSPDPKAIRDLLLALGSTPSLVESIAPTRGAP